MNHHYHQYCDDIIWNIWASHNFQVTFLEASFDRFWLTDFNRGEYEASFALVHYCTLPLCYLDDETDKIISR